jgi:tannase
MYGAVAGLTDGGFGSFETQVSEVILLQNGTINRDALFMFGYQAIHEMSVLGKEFTQIFFNSTSTKLYSYYQGCSEGGRERMSQIQCFPDQIDGVIIRAPVFRCAFQKVQHLWAELQQKTFNYFPPCEFSKMMNETIDACDRLDGKVDGVIARSDLC